MFMLHFQFKTFRGKFTIKIIIMELISIENKCQKNMGMGAFVKMYRKENPIVTHLKRVT